MGTLSKLEKKLVESFKKNNAVVSATCESLRISRNTFYLHLKANQAFRDAIDEIKYRIDDMLEQTAVAKALVDKDTAMLIFMLKTRLKNRGYIERIQTEVESRNTTTLNFNGMTFDEKLALMKELENKSSSETKEDDTPTTA